MNKKKSQNIFNFICLGATGIFVLGILWLWRGQFGQVPHAQPAQDAVVLPSVPRLASIQSKIEPDTTSASASVVNPEPANTSATENTELPASVNLAVPFTSQAPEGNWDQPWQDACEEAAILMLDAYYKEYSLSPLFAAGELVKMVDWEEEQLWGGSIEIAKVAKVVEHYIGSDSRIITNPTIEEIKALIAAGHPVLAVADGKTLDNPHFSNGGPVYHALIIRGYTSTHFVTNDPGTRHGEEFAYTYENLMDSIHDWNDGNVPQGASKVLVLQ